MGKLMQRYSEQIHSSFSLPTYLLHARKFGSDLGVNQITTAVHGIPAVASQQYLRHLAQRTVTNVSLAAFPATSPASKKQASASSLTPSSLSSSKDNNDVQMASVCRTRAQGLSSVNTADQHCIMHLTINADSVTQLRHIVIGACGDVVAFIRIQPIAHASRMKVWLGLSKPEVGRIMAVVMQNLSGAEFGQIRPW